MKKCNLFVYILQKRKALTGKLLFFLEKMLIHMFGVFEMLERIYNKDVRERYWGLKQENTNKQFVGD